MVIWLAYSEELCDQACDELTEAWQHLGNRELNVSRLYSDHELVNLPQDGIVVAGLGKVYARTTRELNFIHRLGAGSSLVVMDEAHQAVADTYRLVLDALVLPYPKVMLLGLSATPGRSYDDIEADRQLSAFFKQSKVMLEVPGYDSPVEYLIEEGYIARPQFRDISYQSRTTLSDMDLARLAEGLDVPKDILERLAQDEQRNLCIILEIERLAREHERILVFAASIEHSDLLAAILQARGLKANSVTGTTPREQRARLIAEFKSTSVGVQILCNFGVLTTGFDAPRTSAVVIGRPTKSLVLYSQMVGRGIRGPRAGGNKQATIATVIDQELPGFHNVSEAFRNWEDVWEN